MLNIGLAIGHDASIAVVDSNLNLIYAASEERFSRKKGHLGSPFLAFNEMVSALGLNDKILQKSNIFIGSCYSEKIDWVSYLFLSKNFQNNIDLFNIGTPPGALKKLKTLATNCTNNFTSQLSHLFNFDESNIKLINHHDSHASSAFFCSGQEQSCVITLDGNGDGECGTITLMDINSNKKIVKRIPEKYSLGHFYSEITKRYGFKESRHEGKITGLAAHSNLIYEDEFKSMMCVKKGKLKFGKKYYLDPRTRHRLELWKQPNNRIIFKHAISQIEKETMNYPDLAFLAQKYLEDTVVNLVKSNLTTKDLRNISLAGGVFSNVVLNQRLRKEFDPNKFFVFPNMGDGGLSVGAIFEGLRRENYKFKQSNFFDMYQGSNLKLSKAMNLTRNSISSNELADMVHKGKIIGMVTGRMEFGPRALCHRSIIASAKNADLNQVLNKRLSRTEFMPFAPVVRDIDFEKVFVTELIRDIDNLAQSNFRFMTETIHVKDFWKSKIPAVVHLDGTARPQILFRKDNPLLYDTLGITFEKYEEPALINTSFNAHEEPIICTEDDAITELEKGRIDILVSEGSIITLS